MTEKFEKVVEYKKWDITAEQTIIILIFGILMGIAFIQTKWMGLFWIISSILFIIILRLSSRKVYWRKIR